MPRFPEASPHAVGIRTATFSGFGARLAAGVRAGKVVPLHLGDVHHLPPAAARALDLDDPFLHRYGPVCGLPALRRAGAEDLRTLGLEVGEEEVFVTAGATGGLDLALNAVCAPGDEVLVLTPTWPLLLGLLQRRGVRPREVCLAPAPSLPPPAELAALLGARLGPKTVGLSLCDPNNPVGFRFSSAHLAALAQLASEHGLWIFYDAVYADMIYAAPARPLEGIAPWRERSFVALSYSKSLSLAGQRVGLLVPPPAVRELLPRLCTHSTYHAAVIGQRMALAALETGSAASARAARRSAASAGAERTRALLGGFLPVAAPEAGAFVWLDLRTLAERAGGLMPLLSRCLDAGVSLAPGPAFGRGGEGFARLCTTAVPPEALEEGLRRLRAVFEGLSA